MYKCIKCEKKFKNNKRGGIINHFISHGYKKTEAIDLYYKNYININNNEIITKYNNGYNANDLSLEYEYSSAQIVGFLNWLGVKKRSPSESKLTTVYLEKIKKTCVEKYGVENPSQSPEIKKKKMDTMLSNFGRINNFSDKIILGTALNNRDIKQMIINNKIAIKKKYGVDNIAQIPEIRIKNSKSQKERFFKMTPEERKSGTEKARSCITFISKPELFIQEILNELVVEYTCHQFICKYNFDIVINKKIIEIQGDLYHAWPGKYKKDDLIPVLNLRAKEIWAKDKNKKEMVENKGYKVYYIWENEIKKLKKEQLIKKIKEIIYDTVDRKN